MTDTPAPPPSMTPNQMRAIVYKIAVSYLEVERGLRPPDQLEAFLTPDEYHRHRVTRPGRAAASHPVRPTDIGRARIDVGSPDHVGASVMVRRDEGRWSALLIDLKQTGRGWQVERLDRLERLVPREPRHIEVDEDVHDRRRRFVENERRAVEAVSMAAARRYERVPDKRLREAKSLRDERDRWRARLEVLQAEAASLDTRDLVEDLVSMGEAPDRDERTRAQPAVKTILGPRPEGPHQAVVWDRADEALTAYLNRWEMESPSALLQSACLDAQESDRRELLRLLARAAHELETRRSRHPALETPEQSIVSVES